MLSARKIELLARLKVQGIDLRVLELNFYMGRYQMVSGLSGFCYALAYVGIIKIKIPEDQLPFLGYSSWQVNTFYICSTLSMCFSLFNLTVTSFCLVLAQGLSLRGPPGSQARAVAIFVKQWDAIRFVLAVSLMTIVIAALSIAWMKLEDEAHAMKITPIFITFIVVGTFVKMAAKLAQMAEQMEVTAQDLVGGDVNVNIPGVNDDNQLDLVMEEAERIDAAKT